MRDSISIETAKVLRIVSLIGIPPCDVGLQAIGEHESNGEHTFRHRQPYCPCDIVRHNSENETLNLISLNDPRY